MAATVETRDPYTAGHQRRVADLAHAIALEMGLSAEEIEGVRLAAVIHDIGKISIPAEILSKPVSLTEIEYQLIKTHPQTGYDILKDNDFPWPVARIVVEHHERMDGSGYPAGLKGEAFPSCPNLRRGDVVEAVASHRPHRPARNIEAALDEIGKYSGILYDPRVVEACSRLFRGKDYRLVD
jgi:putative nucleotidyltransferase with HDIG domain